MLYRQAPAGPRIILKRATDARLSLQHFFEPYIAHWYASGSAALAAALHAAALRSTSKEPEVLMPAYACPALPAAAYYAGLKPVLVDIQAGDCRLSLQALEQSVGKDTVAVVAVDLFGIEEQGEALRAFARQHDLILIEDSAQYFPSAITAQAWYGDYIVLSFGRGKPVSLLHGGAVLSRSTETGSLLPTPLLHSRTRQFRFKTALYNLLISPYAYWLPQSLPFLRLGATRYMPLTGIADFSDDILAYLPANLRAYQGSSGALARRYALLIAAYPSEIIRPLVSFNNGTPSLSRFPVLLGDSTQCEQLYSALHVRGVGASRMYEYALPRIEGVPDDIRKQGSFPHAEDFAACLLTLPLHERVRERDMDALEAALDEMVKHVP